MYTEVEVGAMRLPAKERQGLPAATRKLEESKMTPRASEKAEPYHHLDFRLLDSEARENKLGLFVRHPVCGTWLWQP